jgi:predicted ArsR family transcriptional regulator
MMQALSIQHNFRERIIETLKQHPEGLTFNQISVELGAHRHTITKYIYELKGEGTIFVRDLKTLKLCYLKKNFKCSKAVKRNPF